MTLTHLLFDHNGLNGLEHVNVVGKNEKLGACAAHTLDIVTHAIHLGLASQRIERLHNLKRVVPRCVWIPIDGAEVLELLVDFAHELWAERNRVVVKPRKNI